MKPLMRKSLCPLDGYPTKQRHVQTQVSSPYGGYYTEGKSERVQKVIYYYVAVCEMCEGILLYSAETGDVKKNFAQAELLWPTIPRLPENVPKSIVKFHHKAMLAQVQGEADDFALNIRRALEALCTDLGASKKDEKDNFRQLIGRIQELADKDKIPSIVRDMMQTLRAACNFGGHAVIDEKDVDPVFHPMIETFFNTVIQLVYVVPIKLAEFDASVKAAKLQINRQPQT